jgi:hypothetical protein
MHRPNVIRFVGLASSDTDPLLGRPPLGAPVRTGHHRWPMVRYRTCVVAVAASIPVTTLVTILVTILVIRSSGRSHSAVTPVQATGTMPSSEPGSVLLGGLARTAWLQVTDDEGISRPLAFMGQWQDPVPMALWIDPITTAMFQLYGDGSIDSPVRTDEGHGHDRNRGVSAALRTYLSGHRISGSLQIF